MRSVWNTQSRLPVAAAIARSVADHLSGRSAATYTSSISASRLPMRGDSARNPTGQCCGQGRLLGGQTMHALSSQISTVNPFGGCGAGLELGTRPMRSRFVLGWIRIGPRAAVRRKNLNTPIWGGLPGREMPRKLQDVAPVREVVALVQTGKARGLQRQDSRIVTDREGRTNVQRCRWP
jgi:hypothetical protein